MFARRELQAAAACARQGLDGDLLPLRIQLAHSPQVAQQMALEDEPREHVLLGTGAVPVAQGLGAGERIHERMRQNDEAQPQAGVQRLREGADIENALVLREASQRGNAVRPVLEFAVVVVFHHPGALRSRPIEQRQPAHEAHANAERELVAGGDHGHAGRRPALRSFVDVESLSIHRHPTRLHAVTEHARTDAGIAGVFHHRLVADIEKQPADEVDGLLRARGDEHLLGVAANAARHHHPLRNRLSAT